MTESCCPPGRKQAAVLWTAGGRGRAENTPWPRSSKKTGNSIGQLRKWTLPNASELARGLRASAEDIWCQPADEQRIQFTWKKVACTLAPCDRASSMEVGDKTCVAQQGRGIFCPWNIGALWSLLVPSCSCSSAPFIFMTAARECALCSPALLSMPWLCVINRVLIIKTMFLSGTWLSPETNPHTLGTWLLTTVSL